MIELQKYKKNEKNKEKLQNLETSVYKSANNRSGRHFRGQFLRNSVNWATLLPRGAGRRMERVQQPMRRAVCDPFAPSGRPPRFAHLFHGDEEEVVTPLGHGDDAIIVHADRDGQIAVFMKDPAAVEAVEQIVRDLEHPAG